MPSSQLVVFMGIDGGGKSTQIEKFSEYLRSQNRPFQLIWSRGGYTPGMNWLKATLRRLAKGKVPPSGHNPQRVKAFANRRARKLWLTLAILDLAWLYAVRVRWQLFRGRTVLCDRYWPDTLLDFQLNFQEDRVDSWLLWRALVRLAPRPDATFLFLIPVEESLGRSRQKQEPFPDSADTLQKRLDQYHQLAGQHEYSVLDGMRPIDDLAQEIVKRTSPPSDLPSALSHQLSN